VSMRDTPLWTWHVIAGLVILFLGGLHMTIMHLNAVLGMSGLNPAGDSPLDWQNVVFRARQIFFMITYVLLLGAGLFHGLYGLRNILLELNPSAAVQKATSGALVLAGVALFVLGTWAAVATRTVAQAAAL